MVNKAHREGGAKSEGINVNGFLLQLRPSALPLHICLSYLLVIFIYREDF